MNYAILLSGGIGRRINSDIPKQYIRVGKHMVLTYALYPLIKNRHIDKIIIVADESWHSRIIADINVAFDDDDQKKLAGFAKPGDTRQLSIYSALSQIGSCDTVFIHDAARPKLSGALIERCYNALSGHDGVMPALPMKDTVYLSNDGKKTDGLCDREKLFAGQAPELFLFDKYYEANKSLLPDEIYKIKGSSEPAIMAGMDVVIIPGDEKNYKITTDEDLENFEKEISQR